MADQSLIEQKVKTYLDSLSPKARTMILTGIEEAARQGKSDKSLDLFLSVAKKLNRAARPKDSVHQQVMTAFFRPIEPFLYDGTLLEPQRGRIARSTLGQVWTWIVRDVAPTSFAEIEQLENAPDADPATIARFVARARADAQSVVTGHLRDLLQLPRGRQRLSMQLGGDDRMADLEAMLEIHDDAKAFGDFAETLPSVISAESATQASRTSKLIRAFVEALPAKAHHAAAAVLPRLEHPRLLVEMAITLVKSETGKTIAGTPYGAFVDILLSEIGRVILLFEERRDIGDDVATLCADLDFYHELVRALEVRIELDGVPEWTRKLAARKRKMSELIAREIEPAPGLVRRVLRYKTVGDEPLTFDPHLAADATRALRLLVTSRRCVDSLAVNELEARTWREVTKTIDTMAYTLVERARDAEKDQDVYAKKLDAAIEFATVVFGDDYAKNLRRGRNNALAAEKRQTGT